jgi:hypothetical protein
MRTAAIPNPAAADSTSNPHQRRVERRGTGGVDDAEDCVMEAF